jgi:hypothetical protein
VSHQQKRQKVFGFRYKRPLSDTVPRKNNFASLRQTGLSASCPKIAACTTIS